MSLSIICVKQILIMFILVALGFLCGKINLIDKETNSKLSGFVLEVVNPVLIFMSYQQSFNNELLIGLGMSLVLGFISYGVMIFLLKFLYRKNKTNEGIVEQFAAIYSNCAFMGIPLINGLFGEEGVFFLTGYVTVFNISGTYRIPYRLQTSRAGVIRGKLRQRNEHSSCNDMCRRYHQRNSHRHTSEKYRSLPCNISQTYIVPRAFLADVQVV